MLQFIKYLPLVLTIWKRAQVLLTANQSDTTKSQKMVALPVALAVALLGYFIPQLSENAVALTLVAGIVGLIAPSVSRFVAYKKADVKENLTLMLVSVRKLGEAWYPFTGTMIDAGEEGWAQGLTSDGGVYEIVSGKLVDTIKLKGGTQEESEAKMKEFMDAIRAKNKDLLTNGS
jgi:hypothetical protein